MFSAYGHDQDDSVNAIDEQAEEDWELDATNNFLSYTKMQYEVNKR